MSNLLCRSIQTQRQLSSRANFLKRSFSRLIHVNGKDYRVPEAPVIAVSLDGTSQDYIDAASVAGRMQRWQTAIGENLSPPKLEDFLAGMNASGTKSKPLFFQASEDAGHHALVTTAMPTFPESNNVCILTGGPPRVGGVVGTVYLDLGSKMKKALRMDVPEEVRSPTILGAFSRETSIPVVLITETEAMRRLLSADLDHRNSFSLSVEAMLSSPAPLTLEEQEFLERELGIEGSSLESVWEAEVQKPENQAVLAGFEAEDEARGVLGLQLATLLLRQRPLQLRNQPFLLYLQTSSAVQQRHRPGTDTANAFYGRFDEFLGEWMDSGTLVGVTSAHGMRDKHGFGGQPRSYHLSENVKTILRTVLQEQEAELSEADLERKAEDSLRHLHVLLPNSLSHRLSGWATLYLTDPSLRARQAEIMDGLRKLEGVYSVMNREEACQWFELPGDRLGDICVIGDEHTVFTETSQEVPDNSSSTTLVEMQLEEPPKNLRSFGALSESVVPMFVSRTLRPEYFKIFQKGKFRNYDLFDLLLNGVLPKSGR